jgi:hypothetical protein
MMSKIRAKDKFEVKCERFVNLAWKEVRFDYKKMMNWLFFYQPKNSADKTWHFIGICIVDILLLKVFNLI